MNSNIPISANLRKASIFSIVSDTSLDYSTINSEQNESIAKVFKTFVTKQHSRISLSESKVEINREVLSFDELRDKYGNESKLNKTFNEEEDGNDKSVFKQLQRSSKRCLKRFSFLTFICGLFPIIKWFKNYSFKQNILYDLIAGLTLSMILIPESMANGDLSGLGPAYGLYVAFFPGLVYILMGTSHHTSIGTFSIISIMARDVVFRIQDENFHQDVQEYSKLEIMTSLCLLCGLFQFLMSFFHLGALSVLLSDSISSAFTSAAAVQVVTTYMPTLFDIELPQMNYTVFSLVYEWIGFFENLDQINYITIGISLCSLTVLLLVQELLEPLLKNRFRNKIPLPSDLIIVISMTIISWLLKLNEKHSVEIVGNIPKGIPSPRLPRIDLFHLLIWDAIVISIVSYAVSVSMAKTFAKKHNYKIDTNQELIAMASGNLLGSFFNCYPSSSSLSRSSVLDRVGAKSHLSNIVSIIVLLLVILFLEPLLYHLPKCILSTIVLVALKSMFVQIIDIKRVFKYSKLEGISWIITFTSVIVLDVDIGLLVAIGFSLLLIGYKLSKPYNAVIGRLPNTELYVNIEDYNEALELQGIKIFHFSCALFFLNRNTFKESLFEKVLNISSTDFDIYIRDNIRVKSQIQSLIIDCSSMFYIDSSGLEILVEIANELSKFKIEVLLASCQPTVIQMLVNSGSSVFETKSIYVSVHDAVIKCLSHNDITNA